MARLSVACLALAWTPHALADPCPTPAAAAELPRHHECLVEAARTAYRERRYPAALEFADRLGASGDAVAVPLRVAGLLVRAQALFQSGRIEEMDRAARAAWDLARAQGGADARPALEAQNLVAVALRRQGRTKEAIETYRDLVARRDRIDGPAADESLRARNNYASALGDAGDLATAESILAEVHAARLATLGPNHEQTVFAWHNLKTTAWERRGSDETLREVELALPAQQQALGAQHPEIARMKTLLATMYWSQGRLDEARVLLADVLATRHQSLGAANRRTQEAARNLAFVTLQLGDSDGALDILEAARKSAATSNDTGARELRQLLAFIRLQRGEAREALDLLAESAVTRDESLRGKSRADLGAAFLRAAVLSRLGRHDEALLLQGRLLEAEEARLGRLHPDTLQALRSLATIQVEAGREAAARETLDAFIERTEARDGAFAGASDTHRRRLSQGIESLFQLAGYKTQVRLLASTDATRALEVAELAKGRTLAEPQAVGARDGATRKAAREAAWRLAKAEEALAANEPGSPLALRAANDRAEAEATLRALRPVAGTSKRVGLAERVATLPKGVAFVDYVIDGDRVVAILAGRDMPVTAHDLGRMARLAETVDAFRRLVASPDPAGERVWRTAEGFRWALSKPADSTGRARDSTEIARILSKRLLDPIAAPLGKSPRWAVSPDGPLAFLPFDLLDLGGKRVVDNHEITIAPSLAAVTAGKAKAARVLGPGANREFLGIGVSRAGGEWPELPAAEREVTTIGNLFPSDRRVTLTGAQATEAALARLDASGDLERFRYIHIASHAFLSPRGSSLSGVVLAPDPADAANDGIVTAAEWPVHRLRSDLVVLSACDTGRGTVLAGEGVMGLPYALLLAGTRDVLLTLWPVPDAAAADFMPRFYARLRKGMPPPRALRETKLEFSRSRGPQASAANWAAFVLHGVP